MSPPESRGPLVHTALVLYGGLGQIHPEGCYPVAEAARFHFLETSAGSYAWGNLRGAQPADE